MLFQIGREGGPFGNDLPAPCANTAYDRAINYLNSHPHLSFPIVVEEAGFPHVYLFRPAYIYPVEPRKEPNFSYRFLRAVYPVFRLLFPNQVVRTNDLARAMLDVVVRGTVKQ
jgi:hypothetical protein